MSPSLLWLRRDLRLADQPALSEALALGEPVYELHAVEKVEHDAVQEKVRAQLGTERYHAALARGAAMGYDELVSFVLGEVNRMLLELEDDA